MRFLVMGAGALGCAFGGMLAASRHEVTLVGRERLMKPIREKGLRISGIWGEHLVRLHAFSSVSEVLRCGGSGVRPDCVLLTTKAYDTENAMEELKPLLAESPSTVVLSLQNGIGNVQTIAKFVGEERTLGGMVITGFEIVSEQPVNVRVTVSADKTKIGALNGEITPRLLKIVDAFNNAGIPSEAVKNIHSHIWAKAIYNAALNPLSAIFKVPYGALSNENAFAIIERIVEEAFAVANAENIKLFWDSPAEYLKFLRDVQLPKTASHHSSMLKDIERGKRTEIDFINGVFVRLGRKYNIPTPVNEIILRQIKFLEARKQA